MNDPYLSSKSRTDRKSFKVNEQSQLRGKDEISPDGSLYMTNKQSMVDPEDSFYDQTHQYPDGLSNMLNNERSKA